MYLNFEVFYNTYKTKTIIVNVLIFPTIQALCTFNATKKNRGLYLIPVKCYNDLKTAYHAEKHAMYNAPTVSPSGSANSPVINIEETSTWLVGAS